MGIFPEMWSAGYNIPEDIAKLSANVVLADSTFVISFGNLVKDLNMAIGITFLEKHDLLPRNTLSLFDRLENNVLTYAKVHTCDFSDECRLTAGNDFYISVLEIEQGIEYGEEEEIYIAGFPIVKSES